MLSASSTSDMLVVRAQHKNAIRDSRTNQKSFHEDEFVDNWIAASRQKSSQKHRLVPLEEVDGWRQDTHGNICHNGGRFFSIIGVHVRHRLDRHEIEWDQPIIEQPETGILGIIAKSINGVLHFCLQAKEEPGNIGGIQLSPTVQATYSNYTGAHGGAVPLFLDLFLAPVPERIIFARLQTEDGGRFLYKSNRNMIVLVGEEVPHELPESFIWLTLRQIVQLIARSNTVNACVRSILSCLLVATTHKVLSSAAKSIHTERTDLSETTQWLDDRKAANHIQTNRIGLNELQEWSIDESGFFSHKEKRFFRIVGLHVSSKTREVRRWGQPILESQTTGIIGLLIRKSPTGIELLMQAKVEVGNRSVVQLGPTVQFSQRNYEGSQKLKKPFLYNEFLTADQFMAIHESHQTEEGARFFRESHLHRIWMLPDNVDLLIPSDYRWVPLSHVIFLLHFGEQVNSCARSILSCML